MSRMIGTVSRGLRAPIIRKGDDLAKIVVDSIMQAIKHITEDIQTIGVEATPEQAVEFAEAATPMGAVRFPQIGRMLNFEMPWDGIVLIDRLVKWNTLMGPLV